MPAKKPASNKRESQRVSTKAKEKQSATFILPEDGLHKAFSKLSASDFLRIFPPESLKKDTAPRD